MVLGSEVSSEIAMGTVFLDQNKNGILDPREKGLGNVRVSNGLDVVLTDKNGRYELPVQKETILCGGIDPANTGISSTIFISQTGRLKD